MAPQRQRPGEAQLSVRQWTGRVEIRARGHRGCAWHLRPAADREAPHSRAESGGTPASVGEGPAAAPGVQLWIRSPGEASAGLGGLDEARAGRVASRTEGSGPSPRGREGEVRGRMDAGPWTASAELAAAISVRGGGAGTEPAFRLPACRRHRLHLRGEAPHVTASYSQPRSFYGPGSEWWGLAHCAGSEM